MRSSCRLDLRSPKTTQRPRKAAPRGDRPRPLPTPRRALPDRRWEGAAGRAAAAAEGSASWPGSRRLRLLSAGDERGHSFLREGRRLSGIEGKAGEEKRGPGAGVAAPWGCSLPVGSKELLDSPKSPEQQVPGQYPHPSAAPAAAVVFHAAVSLRRANPTELIPRHQSRSLTWKRDRSPSP